MAKCFSPICNIDCDLNLSVEYFYGRLSIYVEVVIDGCIVDIVNTWSLFPYV